MESLAEHNPRGSVLVVEDNPQNMMLVSDLLHAQGYHVLQAVLGNGPAANSEAL